MGEKINMIFKNIRAFLLTWLKFFILVFLVDSIFLGFLNPQCAYGIVSCESTIIYLYLIFPAFYSIIFTILQLKFKKPYIDKILHFGVVFFVLSLLISLLILLLNFIISGDIKIDYSSFSNYSLILMNITSLIILSILTTIYLRYENKLKNLKRVFFNFLKLLAIFIGSFLILRFLFLGFVEILFVISPPSLAEFYYRIFWILFFIILLLSVLFTIFYYRLNSSLRNLFKIFLIISILIWIMRAFILPLEIVRFNGNKLEPYIKNGQYILIQNLDKTIKRGDIVAFKSQEGEILLGMVFALSGEKVAVENGILYINDKPFKEIRYNWDNCYFNETFTNKNGYLVVAPTNLSCSEPQFFLSGAVIHESEIIGKVFLKRDLLKSNNRGF